MSKFTFKPSITLDQGPDGIDAIAVAQALEDLAAQVRQNPSLVEKMEISIDEGEKWVARTAIKPGQIRQSDAGHIDVTPETLRPEDCVTSERASLMSPGLPTTECWVRAVDVMEPVIPAYLRDDLYMIEVCVDIRPWLDAADPSDVEDLAKNEWGFCEEADRVAYFLESSGEPGAVRVFNFLSLNPESPTGDTVGFSLNVPNVDLVEGYLRETRPQLAAMIFDEGIEP